MNEFDKRKIEAIIEERKSSHSFYKQNSKVYGHFLNMEQAAFSDNALTRMQKELIAVGISVVINCESCMQWHIEQAWRSGASKEMLLEAIDVGIEMGGGPATVSSRFALSVLEYYKIL